MALFRHWKLFLVLLPLVATGCTWGTAASSRSKLALSTCVSALSRPEIFGCAKDKDKKNKHGKTQGRAKAALSNLDL